MYVFLPTLAGLLLFALQLLLAVTLLQGFPHLRMCALNTILCILSMEMNVRDQIQNQKNTNRSCQPPPWPPPHRSPPRCLGAAPQWSRRSLLSSPTAPHSSRSQKSGSSETCQRTKKQHKQRVKTNRRIMRSKDVKLIPLKTFPHRSILQNYDLVHLR